MKLSFRRDFCQLGCVDISFSPCHFEQSEKSTIGNRLACNDPCFRRDMLQILRFVQNDNRKTLRDDVDDGVSIRMVGITKPVRPDHLEGNAISAAPAL